VTETNRPPLPADQMTGLRVAGWHVVSDDTLHKEAHRLAVEVARANKAEHRVALAGTAFMSVADDTVEVFEALIAGDVDQALKALVPLVERLEAEAELFSPTTTEVEE